MSDLEAVKLSLLMFKVPYVSESKEPFSFLGEPLRININNLKECYSQKSFGALYLPASPFTSISVGYTGMLTKSRPSLTYNSILLL